MTTPPSMGSLANGTKVERLLMGQMPKPLLRAQRWRDQFRRELERATADRHGSVDLLQAAAINAATVHEAGAAVVRYLLRTRWDQMPTDTILACLDRLGRFVDSRNRQIEKLKLGADTTTALSALYAIDAPTTPETAADATPAAESTADPNACERASGERTKGINDQATKEGFGHGTTNK